MRATMASSKLGASPKLTPAMAVTTLLSRITGLRPHRSDSTPHAYWLKNCAAEKQPACT